MLFNMSYHYFTSAWVQSIVMSMPVCPLTRLNDHTPNLLHVVCGQGLVLLW